MGIKSFIDGAIKSQKGIKQLQRHEGLRLKMYKCTAGANTIGYGRNLDANGIRQNEAELMLKNDIEDFKKKVIDNITFFDKLNSARQWVLINMAFNMGIKGLMKFKNTLAAIERGDYKDAAEGMLMSKWAGQVGGRAKELSKQMETGKFKD